MFHRTALMHAVAIGGLVGAGATPALALAVPFAEDFNTQADVWDDQGTPGDATDDAGWTDTTRDPATFVSSGGVGDSGFTRTSFNFSGFTADPTFGASLVTTRGEANDDASGDAFVGNWIDEGVDSFSGYVRHDHTESLDFFVRFASSFNFPGALAGGTEAFAVAPDTWTKLEVDISENGGPWISFEGSNFSSVFSGVGNIQFGVTVPESLFEQDVTVNFDTDNPTITPEPGSLALVGLGGLALMARRRRSW